MGEHHYGNNPLFENPKDFAEEFCFSYFSSLLVKNLIIDFSDHNLFIEYIFNLIDEFHECLGLNIKIKYTIDELKRGFFIYFPLWLDTALKNTQYPNFLENMINTDGYIDLSMLKLDISAKSEKIQQYVIEKLKNQEIIRFDNLNKPIGYKEIPLGLFPIALETFKKSNIREISRIFLPPDQKDKKSKRNWDEFSFKAIKYNIEVFISHFFKIYSNIIAKYFPLLINELSITLNTKYIIQLVPEKKDLLGIPFPPFFIEIFVYEEPNDQISYRFYKESIIKTPKSLISGQEIEIEFENRTLKCKYYQKNIEFIFNSQSLSSELSNYLSKKIKGLMKKNFEKFIKNLKIVKNQSIQ